MSHTNHVQNQPGSPVQPSPSTSEASTGSPATLLQVGDPVNEWVYDLNPDIYHADRTRVNSSLLKTIRKSARSFYGNYIGKWPETEKKSRKFGSAAHCGLLEGQKGIEARYRVMPTFTGLTKDGRESNQSKEAREKKAAWISELPPGCEIVTQEDLGHIYGIVEAVLEHPDAVDLLKNGVPEVTGFYVDPATGIRCRIRPDFLSFNCSVLTDFKTTRDVMEFPFQNQMVQLGMDFSEAMYANGIEIISGKRPEFISFICVEPEPPYECAVYTTDLHVHDRGNYQYRQALEKLKRCIDTNTWPRYQERMQTISLPKYLLERAEW